MKADATIDSEPVFDVYVDGSRVATLVDPEWEDMFWCSYRVEPTSEEGDRIVHDEQTWELVNFVVRDTKGGVPNPNTFSGGHRLFCDRKSDRLSFRSLWPPQPSMVERCGAALKDRIVALLRWMGYRRDSK